jgi:hypothetical protein
MYNEEMAGYSSTPLPQKLGIEPGMKIAFISAPASYREDLKSVLSQTEVSNSFTPSTKFDFIHLFVRERADLEKQFVQATAHLAKRGMIWVSWPKKTSQVETNLDENQLREIGLPTGMVDIKVCAIDEIWSALKFVRRKK